MNKFLSAALLMFTLGTPLPAFAQDATAEAAIRAIIAEQVVAWNAGDGTRYASHLAPEASFTNLFGMVMYGAPAFASRPEGWLWAEPWRAGRPGSAGDPPASPDESA